MATAVADVRFVEQGKSHWLLIPDEIYVAAGLRTGDGVRLSVDDGQTITVTPIVSEPRYRRAGNRSIEEIFAGYAGPPMGEEWIRGSVGAEILDD